MRRFFDFAPYGRGGGSAEDLWAFNDETLARTIAACPIPVISAVGHESDFTICDFVADCRAPTPSAAAELAVPDRGELISALQSTRVRMGQLVTGALQRHRKDLERLSGSTLFRRPELLLDSFRMRLGEREARLDGAVNRTIEQSRYALSQQTARLQALSPLAVLSRGYAAVSRDGAGISSAGQICKGDLLTLRFADGQVRAIAQDEKG